MGTGTYIFCTKLQCQHIVVYNAKNLLYKYQLLLLLLLFDIQFDHLSWNRICTTELSTLFFFILIEQIFLLR